MIRLISKRALVLLASFVITVSGLATMQAANAGTSAKCNLNTKVANAVCDEIVYGTIHRVGGLDRKTPSTGGYTDSQMAYITQGQLYRFDENLVPRRDLVSQKIVSKDKLTVTLKLRNARYSDGTPVRAQDAVVSYQRWVASNASPAYIAKVASIREVDFRTIEIKLKSTYPDLDFALASEFFGLHPFSRVNTPAKAAEYFRNPVSAGPMKVKQFTPGTDTFIAEANPNYWAKPVVKQLRVVYLPDATSRQLALQQGTIDYAFELPLTADSIASSTLKIFPHFDPGTFMLAINMDKDQTNPALKDARVRRAISLAIDRAQIMRVAFGGKSKPNCGMQYNVNNPLYVCSLPKDGARDLAAARQLLSQAGYANGFKMTMIYPNRVLWPEANAIIKSNLADVGIDVTLKPEPDSNMNQYLAANQTPWEIMWFGNNAATPILQLSNWFAIGGLWAGFVGKGVATDPSDVELNRLLDQANTVTSLKQRRSLLTQLEAKAFESSHFIPIGTRYRLSGTKIAPGIAQPPIPGDLWFHIGINPPLPKK